MRFHEKRNTGSTSYPPYKFITQAKQDCYPEADFIETSDSGASINLISLLGHTAKRIILTFPNDNREKIRNQQLLLIGKWGMDGASNQQTIRQKWLTESAASDEAVFLITFIPLQLKSGNTVLWTNNTPSSVRFCRPVKLIFAKKSATLVNDEYKFYTELLNRVDTYNIDVEGVMHEIRFDLHCTMIDGKVVNYLTDQKSTNCCNVCGVGPKFVNNIPHVLKQKPMEDYYKFGFSILHCWIRFLEFMLHVSYNLDFKLWAARTEEHKNMKLRRKKEIQIALKKKLSLTVDVVKQGVGTTNTGNVARIFFSEADTVADITGLDVQLLKRLHNILQLITCGKSIHNDKFKSYCLETAELYVALYPWYPLPPSVHKVLIHGGAIMESFAVPIGWLSEEAQEASNKVFQEARAKHSRMSNRQLTNIDILHHLLISSDPLINSLRKKEKRKERELSKEVLNMIIESY